ncbi:MAG: Hpt domain-containing protein [Pseudomonadales bacterium]
MSQDQEHFALDWIKSDLLETLDNAKVALEAFSESDQDETRMRACLTSLHQAHGTLVMLELTGVALLADHLERLAQALLNQTVKDTDAAVENIMQGILELPGYLEAIQAGEPDSERPVVPLANQIRAHLELAPLETAQVNVLAGTATEAAVDRFERIGGLSKARKIRSAYQQVLLAILKGDDRTQAVNTLNKVAQGLYRICEDTPMAGQWQAFGEFVSSLERQSGPLDSDAIKLLRRVDAEIRLLATNGVQSLRQPVNRELVEQLLAQAEQREHSSQVLTDLKGAISEDAPVDSLVISGRQALASAALALRDEVSELKDRLDLDVRSQEPSKESFSSLLDPLTQIGSTLSLLGFSSSHATVFDQVDAINDALVKEEFDLDTVTGVADALVKVDENLASATQGMGGKGEVERITSEAHRAVAREARAGLDQVKAAIVAYVSSSWEYDNLSDAPTQLDEVCGALDMIPLARPARQLGECRRYIVDVLPHRNPDWTALDHLADAISGVDYYLERIVEENSSNADGVLDLVDTSLSALDFTVDVEAETSSTAEDQEIMVEAGEQRAQLITNEAPEDSSESDNESLSTVDAESANIVVGADELPLDEESAFASQSFGEGPDEGFDLGSDDFEFELPEDEDEQQAEIQEPPAEIESAEPTEAFADEVEAEFEFEPELEPEPEFEPETAPELETEELAQLETAEPEERAVARDAAVGAIAAAAIGSVAAGLVDEHQDDDEIAEIFLEEAAEVVDQIDHWLPEWRKELGHEEALTELRRAFHTLKGSGRMVGANVVGELAWSIENMLNRVMDNTVTPTDQFVDVARRARDLVPALLHSFEERQAPELGAVGQIIEAADLLSSGGELEQAQVATEAIDQSREPDDAAPVLAAVEEPMQESEASAAAEEDYLEDDTLVVFAEEAREHLDVLRASLTSEVFDANQDAVRALHTLAGSAGIAGVDAIMAIARPAYEIGRACRTQKSMEPKLAARVATFMQSYVDQLADAVETLSSGVEVKLPGNLVSDADALLDQLSDENQAHELLSIEGLGTLFEAVEYLEQWHSGGQDLSFAEQLAATLRRLSDKARTLEHEDFAEFAETLRAVHVHLQDLHLTVAASATLQNAHEQLLNYLDALVAEQTPESIEDGHQELLALLGEDEIDPAGVEANEFAVEELDALSDSGGVPPNEESNEEPEEEPEVESLAESAFNDDELDESFNLDSLGLAMDAGEPKATSSDQDADWLPPPDLTPELESTSAVPTPAYEEASASALARSDADSDFDAEILEIFVEEADELLESLDESIHVLEQERENQLHIENMLRDLHTMKGGARLAALTALGDLTHELESEVLEQQSSGNAASDGFIALLYRRHDALLTMVADVKQRIEAGGVGMAESLAVTGVAAAVAQAVTEGDDAVEPALEPELAEVDSDNVVPLVASVEPPSAKGTVAEPKPAKARPAQTQERAAPDRASQEMVRVGAGLLEELVNLAGESSILRARTEQGLGDFTVALDEMETTIGRVREQLRRLEIETEAQILFRQERFDSPSYEGFDPLEMDRYSQLQQLSRSLSESASDMLDLKETLLYKARESETLLLQQARINTELQEGLMRTRMVPFSRLLPRLRRTVRQVAGELNKDIEFNAFNAEGELDRNLLERMIPPLEHMLRNAVDHGIESPAERSSFGKPEVGQIELRLSREGGDVLIEISDDGAGIDVESVRAKAIERGLMSADAELRDDEVLQFVLAPGFSTAKSVTQISGRGVGMDVVHSEVKQLGGSISIASRPGKGTRFALRVPFTVSVNRALMVSVGDDLYAIPLNTIEGIVLLGPQELEKLYAPDANPFEYAGMSYHVRYLGHFLGREYRGNVSQSSAPVVLVRSGDQSIAVHVDSVQGSREIVVKSLGPQFAGVGGISGATILGDGSVVVILDLLALIRSRGEQPRMPSRRPAVQASKTRTVMVVDDSVTVRKVTSRLLERQGMDVLVAKDGVEAVAMLQERRPDILLLDIEMPRMDGFEVARQVRHDDHLEGLPIVMISSRTGEKHQDRATDLGVNRFLGKPFQESELLETIDQLVKS